MLDYWYQTAGLFWYYYSKVFTVAFLPVVGRFFLILHSHCCNALCKPAATELKSKNAHGLSRSLFTDSFFDFSF